MSWSRRECPISMRCACARSHPLCTLFFVSSPQRLRAPPGPHATRVWRLGLKAVKSKEAPALAAPWCLAQVCCGAVAVAIVGALALPPAGPGSACVLRPGSWSWPYPPPVVVTWAPFPLRPCTGAYAVLLTTQGLNPPPSFATVSPLPFFIF
jgi:hypothetical protein